MICILNLLWIILTSFCNGPQTDFNSLPAPSLMANACSVEAEVKSSSAIRKIMKYLLMSFKNSLVRVKRVEAHYLDRRNKMYATSLKIS